MLGIVVSRADEASEHIGEQLRALADWTAETDGPHRGGDDGPVYRTDGAELRTFDGLHVDLEQPAEPFGDLDLLAFASRHSGDTGPLLTAHHTGNFGPAEFGGESNQLARAAPGALSAALSALESHAPDGYDVGLECTHHGPTSVDVPSLFVEVGSDENAWRDPAAAKGAARAILSLRSVDPLVERSFVGFGGGHYAPRFTRIVRETDWAAGHIAADWGLDATAGLDRGLLRETFERSGARFGVLDGNRPELAGSIEALGYRLVGESWLRETNSVALEFVERAESVLTTVDDGLRFGRPAREPDHVDEFVIVEPSSDLLADAAGIDPEQVHATVNAAALAFETAEAGNRVRGRIAVPDDAGWDRIESGLVDVLRRRFDEVAVEDEAIVAVERAFDPDLARDHGVEPGPSFGRLAGGETVTIGDTTVDPDAVHVTRTHRYPRRG